MNRIKIFMVAMLIPGMVFSQYRKHDYEPYKVIGLYTASILLNAVGDGLNDSGNKAMGHLCNAGGYGLLIASPFVFNVNKDNALWYGATYVTLRMSLFDPTYNMSRGIRWDYIGNSSLHDKALRKVSDRSTIFGKGILLLVGVSIPINEIKSKKLLK